MSTKRFKCPRCKQPRSQAPRGTFFIEAQWCQECIDKDREKLVRPLVVKTYIDPATGFLVKVLAQPAPPPPRTV